MRGMIIEHIQALFNLYGSIANSLNSVYNVKYNEINLYRLNDTELLYLYNDIIKKCENH